MNWLLNKVIKSEYVKAWVLAQARQIVAVVGAGLVAKGYADTGMVETASGLIVLAISFYMQDRDVKNVDKKIQVALDIPPPVRTPSGKLTEEQEIEVTRRLNLAFNKPV